jgi:large subunit ribosomal protein L31
VKTEIHPIYYPDATITCNSCGNIFIVGSTKPLLKVEICSQCHPYFTGEQRIIDTEGRVERMKRRFNLT